MSGDGINIRPDELDKGGDKLDNFASTLDTNTSKVEEAHRGLSAHARSDRSGLGQVLVKFADKTGTAFSDIGKQLSRVIKGSSQRLKAGSKRHRENEQNVADSMDKIRSKGADTKVNTGGQSTTTSSAGGGGSKTHEPPKVPGEGGGRPKDDSTTPSDAGGGGGGGGDKGKGPAADDDGPATPRSTPPVDESKKPITATDQHSNKFNEKPDLDKPTYPGPTPGQDKYGSMPADKSRGAQIEQLDESRVERENGLITKVDGKPVKEWVEERSKQKADETNNPERAWRNANGYGPDRPRRPNDMPGKEGVCSAVAIDLRTGSVTHGVNGGKGNVIPENNLHPLLQQRYQDMRAWQHPEQNADGSFKPVGNEHDGQVAPADPLRHAEVKAANELLWQRQKAGEEQFGPDYKVPESALGELRVDPRWTDNAKLGQPAPCCGNCNSILRDVPSYTGRYQHAPLDPRRGPNMIPPHED
ncbi:MAG TPA: hypothetical protein VHF06_24580 [Pseudonocardiaceae bacterium]|nr:hypothetical protein [Pseudonocardiaceae bacterium]